MIGHTEPGKNFRRSAITENVIAPSPIPAGAMVVGPYPDARRTSRPFCVTIRTGIVRVERFASMDDAQTFIDTRSDS